MPFQCLQVDATPRVGAVGLPVPDWALEAMAKAGDEAGAQAEKGGGGGGRYGGGDLVAAGPVRQLTGEELAMVQRWGHNLSLRSAAFQDPQPPFNCLFFLPRLGSPSLPRCSAAQLMQQT